MSEASRAEACEKAIAALRGTMSDGQLALEALVLYRASGLRAPDWVLREIERCYTNFKTHMPSGGWVAEEAAGAAPRALGDAFGIEPHKGMHARTARLKALTMPRLREMFTGPNALPRSPVGYEEAARRLRITMDQARDWLDGEGEIS